MRAYPSSVLSMFLYGTGTWPLHFSFSARIDGFDCRALRRVKGIFWPICISNEVLRALTQRPPASRIAAMRRVRCYGHLLRLHPHHPTRAMLDFNPAQEGWRCPRGAPRTRWLDAVAQDLQLYGMTLAAAQQLAQARPSWLRLVARVGSTLLKQVDYVIMK